MISRVTMLLDDFTEAQRERIRTWIDDPAIPMLAIEAVPEMQQLAARLIASFEAEEAPVRVFFGHSGELDDAERFWSEAAEGIFTELTAHAPDFSQQGFASPNFRAFEGANGRSTAEERFVDFLEAAAGELASLCQAVVVTVRIEAAEDALLRASVERLGQALGGPRVKIAILDQRDPPRLRGLTMRSHRLVQAKFEALQTDLWRIFQQVARAGDPRVVVMHCNVEDRDAIARQLVESARGPIHVLHLRGRFERAFAFWNAALEQLLARVDERITDFAKAALPGPDEPVSLEAFARAEAIFAREAARVIAQLAPEGGTLFVVVNPSELRKPKQYGITLRWLLQIGCPRSVRFVLVDDEQQPVLDLRAIGAAWELPTQVCHLDHSDIAQAADRALLRPDLPNKERIRCLQITAGFAVEQGDWTKALRSHEQAIELAHASGEHEDEASAWLALGHALYRGEAFAEARNAYLEAATLGLDHTIDALVGQALLWVGHTHFRQQTHVEAIECYRGAREFQRAMNDLFNECQALIWEAESQRCLGRQADADALFREALGRYDSAPDYAHDAAQQGKAEVFARLAQVYQDAGHSSEAQQLRHEAEQHGGEAKVSPQP